MAGTGGVNIQRGGVEIWWEQGDTDPSEPVTIKVHNSWKIDDESFAIKIVDRQRVLPILASSQLQKVASGDAGVAVAFRPGTANQAAAMPGFKSSTKGMPGVVVFVLSHFGHQESNEDEMSIQNLLLNILIDAHAAHGGNEAAGSKKGEKAK